MTLIKRNLFLPTVPQFFDDFLSKDLSDWGLLNNSSTNTTLPSVNILENKDAYLVEMAVPGMNKNDFHIELDNETLTISSERERTDGNLAENERYTRREYSYQSFQRSFRLSKKVVDESHIEAKYEDGILRILIPKKEEAKTLPPRRIRIT
jgi:HSP20 family protein